MNFPLFSGDLIVAIRPINGKKSIIISCRDSCSSNALPSVDMQPVTIFIRRFGVKQSGNIQMTNFHHNGIMVLPQVGGI
jgi:hypothetical protein